MNSLHCVGVTGSYEGDEEVAVLVRETESMHKFQIILDFSTYFALEYYCKVVRRLKFTTQCTV